MRILWRMLLFGASLVLLFLAAGWCGQAKEPAGRAVVFLTETWLDKKTGEEICRLEAEQEEGVSLCFWGEKQDVTVSCQETGKSVRADGGLHGKSRASDTGRQSAGLAAGGLPGG